MTLGALEEGQQELLDALLAELAQPPVPPAVGGRAPRHGHPEACAAHELLVLGLARLNTGTMAGLYDAERDVRAARELLGGAERRLRREIEDRTSSQLVLLFGGQHADDTQG